MYFCIYRLFAAKLFCWIWGSYSVFHTWQQCNVTFFRRFSSRFTMGNYDKSVTYPLEVLVKRICSIGPPRKWFRLISSCSFSVRRSRRTNFKQFFKFFFQCLIPLLISIRVSRPVHWKRKRKGNYLKGFKNFIWSINLCFEIVLEERDEIPCHPTTKFRLKSQRSLFHLRAISHAKWL